MIIMYYKWNLDFKTHYNVVLYLHLTRLLYFFFSILLVYKNETDISFSFPECVY